MGNPSVARTSLSRTHCILLHVALLLAAASAAARAATLISVEVTPINPSIVAGHASQLAATGVYSDGSARDVTRLAKWSSSSPAVASVRKDGPAAGLVTAAAALTQRTQGNRANIGLRRESVD